MPFLPIGLEVFRLGQLPRIKLLALLHIAVGADDLAARSVEKEDSRDVGATNPEFEESEVPVMAEVSGGP